MYHIGKWNEILSANDVEKIWSELHRIVSKHKLARIDAKYNGVYQQGKYDFFTDLTQELFTVLLSKNRFDYYLSNQMSDVEIEVEITQIELTNMLNKQIRTRFPESFRISRRISNILKTSDAFKRYDTGKNVKLGNQIYGLTRWPWVPPIRATDIELFDRIARIKPYKRDTRLTGATADTHVIISNKDLKELVENVIIAADSALSVKQIRSAVLSKLPIMDVNLVHISDYKNEDNEEVFELPDTRLNPEQLYINKDFELKLDSYVDLLFNLLNSSVNNRIDKNKLILNILWHTYFNITKPNQYAISKILKVSDATVHNYRKIIEEKLKELKISNLDEALKFQQVLRTRLEKDLALINTYKVMGE